MQRFLRCLIVQELHLCFFYINYPEIVKTLQNQFSKSRVETIIYNNKYSVTCFALADISDKS